MLRKVLDEARINIAIGIDEARKIRDLHTIPHLKGEYGQIAIELDRLYSKLNRIVEGLRTLQTIERE